MGMIVTYQEALDAFYLAQEAFFFSIAKAAKDKRFNLPGASDNYKELFAHYITLKNWKQSKFSSDGYNNITTKEQLLSIVSRINKIK